MRFHTLLLDKHSTLYSLLLTVISNNQTSNFFVTLRTLCCLGNVPSDTDYSRWVHALPLCGSAKPYTFYTAYARVRAVNRFYQWRTNTGLPGFIIIPISKCNVMLTSNTELGRRERFRVFACCAKSIQYIPLHVLQNLNILLNVVQINIFHSMRCKIYIFHCMLCKIYVFPCMLYEI